MEQDIHKLADWLVKVTREGIAIERKVLALEAAEKKAQQKAVSNAQHSKVS